MFFLPPPPFFPKKKREISHFCFYVFSTNKFPTVPRNILSFAPVVDEEFTMFTLSSGFVLVVTRQEEQAEQDFNRVCVPVLSLGAGAVGSE
jgi:hypothetical protein